MKKLTKKFGKKFGKNSPLMYIRGEVLEYLGISIDYRQKGKVRFFIKEYIKNYWKKHHMTRMEQPRHRQPTICLMQMKK